MFDGSIGKVIDLPHSRSTDHLTFNITSPWRTLNHLSAGSILPKQTQPSQSICLRKSLPAFKMLVSYALQAHSIQSSTPY